jgi:hypothetical protein
MATAAEVAAWLQEEFARTGYLARADAVAGIRARFGAGFTVGGKIRWDVLHAFRALDPAGRVWVASRQAWRRRNAHDPPFGTRGRDG